jgi:hypothetical protein
MDQESRIASKEYLIFSDLVEALRELVRKHGVTVHLFNNFDQPLLQISPELVEFAGLYEDEFKVMRLDGTFSSPTKISYEDRRPICPKCSQKAELEPAHWTRRESKQGQWRWVCVACDYAVSTRVDEPFSPDGEMACRGKRELRAHCRRKFSMLWEKGVMSKKDAYELLKQHFGGEKGERVTFASMSVSQMKEAVDLCRKVTDTWKEQQKGQSTERTEKEQAELAANEMRQLYSAITHEAGEPTYLGDGMYLFPDGRIDES